MKIRTTATLTLLLLLVAFAAAGPSAGARRTSGSASRPNVVTTQTPDQPKVENAGGPKTETKAGRQTGPAVLAAGPSSTLGRAGRAAPPEETAQPAGASAAKGSALYDVGVIPGNNGCPSGSGLVQIYMDSQDKNNANASSGWIGATAQDLNIRFKFCRVSGTTFSTPLNVPYAVLQLSNTCPAGSYSFWRDFDNETHKNNNSFSVDPGSLWLGISPNSQYQNFLLHSFTRLHFCVFSPAANPQVGSPGTFPDLGIEYGVFAPHNLPGALAAGALRSDDEDTLNMNRYALEYGYHNAETAQIISDNLNTDIRFAKVKDSPPPPQLHSVSLSPAIVKGGNNGPDPVLTVTLDRPAPPGGQKVYVSSSNTNVAWVHGAGYFYVPAGQTSESLSWFLGTKNVLTNRIITITVTVNGQQGYADLGVKK